MTRRPRRRLAALTLAALAAGCVRLPEAPTCVRVEGVTLVPENGFAAIVDSDALGTVDDVPERIDVAFLVVRPLRGPIELVHVVGDDEMERWTLTLPESGGPAGRCSIGPGRSLANCGATLRELPHPTEGYYYLKPNGNVILEAGVSFFLCR